MLPCILFWLASQSCIVLHWSHQEPMGYWSHGVMVTLYKARAAEWSITFTACTVEPSTESKAWKKWPTTSENEARWTTRSWKSPEIECNWSYCFILSRSSGEGIRMSEGTLGRLHSQEGQVDWLHSRTEV